MADLTVAGGQRALAVVYDARVRVARSPLLAHVQGPIANLLHGRITVHTLVNCADRDCRIALDGIPFSATALPLSGIRPVVAVVTTYRRVVDVRLGAVFDGERARRRYL